MKKIIAFASRPDEMKAFEKFSKALKIEVKNVSEYLSLDNVDLTKGYLGVAVLGNCDVSKEVLVKLSDNGVKYVASRSTGYNNIDMKVAKELGIKVSNATYSPNCVADFAVMLALMVNRRMIESIKRTNAGDYSVRGLQGRELKNQTIGIIGTGRIGRETIKNFSGFGCKIIGFDPYENEEIKEFMDYVPLEKLLAEADIISLHAPLFKENHNIINKKNIEKMKDGVIIINTSRGELINTKDLIEAIKSGKIFGVGLDVLEDELGIYHKDRRFDNVINDEMAILKSLKNVVLTNHFGFYTDQAVSDMVEVGLTSLSTFLDTDKSEFEIK